MDTKLKDYIDYWNEWHEIWFTGHPFVDKDKIGHWTIPKEEMGNDLPSFNYFPEPYLLSKIDQPVDAVFLNINPGKGGPEQIHGAKDSLLINLYGTKHSYSDTISSYLYEAGNVRKKDKNGNWVKNKEGAEIYEPNGTAKWFKNKRINWAKKLLASDGLAKLFDDIEKYNSGTSKSKLGLNNLKRIKSELNLTDKQCAELGDYNKYEPNILCADLIPWHSSKASDIHEYIQKHNRQILLFVLVPLIEIAGGIKDDKMKNKIFVRGVTFRNIVNNILKNKNQYVLDVKHHVVFKENDVIDEFNSLITTFTSVITLKGEEIKTKWYVFTAGQSMFLPDLNYKYVVECFDNTGVRKCLREFLNEQIS